MGTNTFYRYLSHLIHRSPSRNLTRGLLRFRRGMRDLIGIQRVLKEQTHITQVQIQRALIDGLQIDDLGSCVRRRAAITFPISMSNQPKILDALKQLNPEGQKNTVAAAENVCAHRFDILGSGLVDLGLNIDWHCDFKTGYRWPNRTYYRKIDGRYLESDGDIKIPWDLSRAYQLPTLGRAYWITGDERYPAEFVSQVNSWIISNPPQDGVNWVNAMEVAIRAINWLWAYYLLLDSPYITPDFEVNFFGTILAHGRYIIQNLEGEPGNKFNGNHYLSDIVGLIVISLLIPEFRESKKWREFGLSNLVVEMKNQVLADGVDFELSISYHRLVTELFVICAVLCRYQGIKLPSEFWRGLEKMIEFTYHYTRPDGTAPIIGDADNGRVLRLMSWEETEREYYDHRHLLALGAILFNRPELGQAVGKCWEEAFWILGTDAVSYWRDFRNITNNAHVSRAFSSSGVYILRKDEFYSLMDAGGNGRRGVGDHSHNDCLSVEIYSYGLPFLVDPGSYVYTADFYARNLFRSTAYHNTIQIDGQEINRFDPKDVFQLSEDAKPQVLSWVSTPDFDFLVASHTGYMRLPDPVLPQRTLFFDKVNKLWLIWDHIKAQGEHKIQVFFHFSPIQLEKEIENSKNIVAKARESGLLSLSLLCDPGFTLSMHTGWVSCSYGLRKSAPIAEYHAILKGDQDWLWGLYPSQTDELKPETVATAFNDSCQKLKIAYKPFGEIYW